MKRTLRGAILVGVVGAVAACDGASVVGGPRDAGSDLGDVPSLDTSSRDDASQTDGPSAPTDLGAPDGGPTRCASAAACVGDPRGPSCDLATGQCAPCTPADDRCPSGQYCTAQNACAAGCRDDAACAAGGAGARCNTATRQCVACVTDDHCALGARCLGNACVMGCSPDRGCPNGQTCCEGGCVDTQSNIASCGGCAMRCAVPNAQAACAAGVCGVGACTAPFADCDRSAGNGCETDTQRDVAHCGGCAMACAARANAGAACMGGVCVYTCAAGFDDCDGDPSNGCEADLNTDVARCGACANRCAVANATARCVAGRCAVGACAAGFAACDSDPGNGCETSTETSVMHCGGCGQACAAPANAAATCEAGRCSFTCQPGFADCDGNASNGCEVDTRSSATHCGACNRGCALSNATAQCAGSRCTVAQCAAGAGDCDGEASNGCEANLRTSASHCGACGRSCATGEVCEAGACARAVEVTGCGVSDGGTVTPNTLSRFCSVRGGVGMLSGALGVSGAQSATLRIATGDMPSGARIVSAMLYRLTYDRTSTYGASLFVDGTGLESTTRRLYVTPSGSPYEVLRADMTAVLRNALPRAVNGTLELALGQTVSDSSGGFGWWIVYAAPSLAERHIVIYDGGHTDTQPGNGSFALDGFVVGAAPVRARLHLHGGGDGPNDAPSTARFTTSRGVITLNDVTDPSGGLYAGTQAVDVASVLAPGDLRATLDFTLRNYSGVAFAALEVSTDPPERCAPACASGETCLGGRCQPSLGCARGARVGFRDVSTYPAIAACGGELTYDEVAQSESALCAAGWGLCTPSQLNAVSGLAPDLSAPRAWLHYVDPATDRFGDYLVPACGGLSPAVANLRGTAACTPGGNFPEGWRLAVTPSLWSSSHQSSSGCIAHAHHVCAFAGGSVAQVRGAALCCRRP